MTLTNHPGTARRAGFPFPFRHDTYRYSTNIESAGLRTETEAGVWGERMLDIDGEYHDELAQRAAILAADPARCVVLPHMRVATWDTMFTLMQELSASYPDTMHLTESGGGWTWRNDLLDTTQAFVLGDDATLPTDPLRYIGSQIQEDLVLLDQRHDDLFLDAGLVTFAADWSLTFDVGMRFLEIHGPVPRIHETGVISRAHQVLLRLTPEESVRRTNWTMTVGRRLDTATEVYPQWGPDRAAAAELDEDEFGRVMQLRVEVQHLRRLPQSGAVLFLIRTYLISLAELAVVPEWGRRLAGVLSELPPDMADYKGLTRYRDRVVRWLAAHPGGH